LHEVKIDFFPANYVVVNSDMKVMINPNDFLPSLEPARRKTFQENEGGGYILDLGLIFNYFRISRALCRPVHAA